MTKYWILKTREEKKREENSYKEHWPRFKQESVIAIGWGTGPNRGNTSIQELQQYLKQSFYPDATSTAQGRAKTAARTVWKFIKEMDVGDKVILCRGYAVNGPKEVIIHGIASITGPYCEHADSDWFKRKRQAHFLRIIDKTVPRAHLAEVLGRDSLTHTIHKVCKTEFEQTEKWLNKLVELA